MVRSLEAMSGRPPRTNFLKYVAELPTSSSRLGLTHVTSGYFLREMLDSKRIWSFEDCNWLKKPLVYAFYGRAAYRSDGGQKPSDIAYLFPAIFILDPDKLPAPKHVFGFDSGAFMSGMLDDYLDPYMPLFDFHLEPNIQSAARLTEAFFPSTDDFLANKPKESVEVSQGNYEVFSYSKFIKGYSGGNQLDDRISTPEIIFDKPLDIEKCVRAVIMPDVLASDPDVGGKAEAMGIRVDEYEWSGGSRPSEYHMAVRKIACGIYEDFGWI